jgi:Protein of unknown function (DUF3300)/Chaperone of endosialidase
MMTHLSRLVVVIFLWCLPVAALAQSPQPAAAPAQPLLKPAELDQMLAPIALYPDPLLTQVLIAATYPLEVVQADRWAKANTNLKGEALTAALAKQSWDDSIKSLVQVPTVLTMMGEQLDWTQKLGDAMLAQQADVMDSVQRLRARAQANGKLKSGKEQTVSVKTEDNNNYIVIEPTSPNEIYVPYYEPAVVYGEWPYSDYAPYYFAPPVGYFPRGVLATGVAFGAGLAVGYWRWGNCDWGRHNINVLNKNVDINNINRNDRNNFSNWQHNADHRHGVKYNNADVRNKFAKTDVQAGKAARQDFRGKEGQQVLQPGRGGAADRPGGGANRPGGGANVADRDRGPDRGGAADRPDRGGSADRSAARDRPGGGGDGPRRDAGKAGGGGGGAKQAARPSGGSPKASPRPTPQRDTAFSSVGSGKATRAQADRGRQSVQRSGGAPRVAGGGGGSRGGAARGGGGGGRRSDAALKQDVVLLGRLHNGLGFYRFSYVGSDKVYVGVLAQEVQAVAPETVVRGRDGYLRVHYEKLGLPFQSYDAWIASGARLPTAPRETRH